MQSAHRRRRRDADAAEERMQWYVDARREVADVLDRIEFDDSRLRCPWEILR
jgi:hypothetical protein